MCSPGTAEGLQLQVSRQGKMEDLGHAPPLQRLIGPCALVVDCCVHANPGCAQALTAKMAEIKNQDMEEEVAQALIQLCVDTMLKVRHRV